MALKPWHLPGLFRFQLNSQFTAMPDSTPVTPNHACGRRKQGSPLVIKAKAPDPCSAGVTPGSPGTYSAALAQLAERCPSKSDVAGSSPPSRSRLQDPAWTKPFALPRLEKHVKSEYRQAVESVIAQEKKLAEVEDMYASAAAQERRLAEDLRLNRETLSRYEDRVAEIESQILGAGRV